jgi:hypothetical protein
MADFTNPISQTLDQLRIADDKLTIMLWNVTNIFEQLTSEQISRQQIH